jgi:hypothetical protein
MRLRESLRKGLHLLGTMLVGEGITGEDQVQQALGEQQQRKLRGWNHKRLGQLLIEMSAVSHDDVDRVLDDQRKARQAAARSRADEAPVAAPSAGAPEPQTAEQRDAPFVASDRGNVYHTRDCKAAQKISAGNLRQFASREQAESAGKRACARCC